MPTLSRLYAKSALLYLVAALSLALLQAMDGVLPMPDIVGALRPVYFHLFLVGWVTQLIFGVMHWMFPRVSREQPRGQEDLMWAVFIALNVGLLLRAIAEPGLSLGWQGPWGSGLAISAALQWGAGIGFVVTVWPRVKER